MATVGIFEAKNRLSELVERASRGEEIVITRRGERVARLMAPQAPDSPGRARALAARIRKSRAGQALGAPMSCKARNAASASTLAAGQRLPANWLNCLCASMRKPRALSISTGSRPRMA